ncbi:MAG: 50S ribosomal protein L34, partial [Syntrophales bacterium]
AVLSRRRAKGRKRLTV